ncbi:hypothetical protein [Hankyongella ginsenosidimutans]|uniref:hypothetical protein n=1 Tax=Hankyongella ginsenosidimutans TaxID=1763828 RepID=UPI001FE8B946|nr:hypothetical protein [Hankyongella ginsenosidimutans]
MVGSPVMWVCRSMKPGMTHWPLRSTTFAVAGTAKPRQGWTAVTMPPSISTARSATNVPAALSNNWPAWTTTSGSAA